MRVHRALLLLVSFMTVGRMPVEATGAEEHRIMRLDEATGYTIAVDGELNYYGNDPHTYLAVRIDPGLSVEVRKEGWQIGEIPVTEPLLLEIAETDSEEGPGMDEVARLAGQRVSVTAILLTPPAALRHARIRVTSVEPAPGR